MEQSSSSSSTWMRSRRFSSNDKRALAICLTLIAILSPLYIDRRNVLEDEEDADDEPVINLSSYLPLLMVMLIMLIMLSTYLESGLCRFDPNLIHRVGGSSTGIVLLLLILALVLKFKSF